MEWVCCSSLQLVEVENVTGVVTLNEEYETKYFSNTEKVNRKPGKNGTLHSADRLRRSKAVLKDSIVLM